MTYESLIFDIDGTLWDSRQKVAEGFNLQLDKEGLQHLYVTVESLTPLFGKAMDEEADIVFATLPQEERLPVMRRCLAAEDAYLKENATADMGYLGIRETIEELSKRYRLFIVSNCQCGYPEQCMTTLGLTPFIQGHLCYGDTGTSKGQTLLTLMKQHNIQNCAYIGDTQGDYEATLEAGIPFIWAAYGFGNPAGWDAKIDSPDELLYL